MDQCRCQLDALLVAMGEHFDPVHATVGQPETFQPPIRRIGGLLGLHPPKPSQVRELVMRPHLGIEAPLLWHVAESAFLLDPYGPAIPCDLTGVGRDQPEDGAHGSGLSGAVGTEKPEHSASVDLQSAPGEGDDLVVTLVQVFQGEHSREDRGGPP